MNIAIIIFGVLCFLYGMLGFLMLWCLRTKANTTKEEIDKYVPSITKAALVSFTFFIIAGTLLLIKYFG